MSVRLPFQASRRMFSSSSIGNAGGIPQTLYKNVWRKSNILYISYIVVGCVAIEAVYGTATTALWDSYNRGKLYKQIDWSKFKSEDDDEE